MSLYSGVSICFVFLFTISMCESAENFHSLGCWADKESHAIPSVEGKSLLLNGNYKTREQALVKCALVAQIKNFNVFALQDGGECATSSNAHLTYKKYGNSVDCASDGKGGKLANDVYEVHP